MNLCKTKKKKKSEETFYSKQCKYLEQDDWKVTSYLKHSYNLFLTIIFGNIYIHKYFKMVSYNLITLLMHNKNYSLTSRPEIILDRLTCR